MSSDSPAYLPPGVVDTLRMRLPSGVTSDDRWKLARLVERAYAEGYQTGYTRGYGDGWAEGRAAVEAGDDDD